MYLSQFSWDVAQLQIGDVYVVAWGSNCVPFIVYIFFSEVFRGIDSLFHLVCFSFCLIIPRPAFTPNCLVYTIELYNRALSSAFNICISFASNNFIMTADIAVLVGANIADPIKQQQQQRKPLHHLFSHTLVSQDFDQLKFHTAASHQIQWHQKGDQFPPTADTDTDTDTRLIASPYNSAPHLLDLGTLDIQSRLFSLALASFKPVCDDYATAEYLDSFNWQEVFDLVKTFCDVEGHTWTKQSFYVVIFRSKLQPGVDQDHLHALDAYSHQEATKSGGLLKYWFGTKNENRQNLATCEF